EMRGRSVPASDDELATVEIEQHGDTVQAVVRGEVDMSNADDIGLRLQAACNGAGALVLDLSQLRFLDSHGVAAIFELHRELAAHNRSLQIFAGAESMVARVLDLTGMAQIIPVSYADSEPAHD